MKTLEQVQKFIYKTNEELNISYKKGEMDYGTYMAVKGHLGYILDFLNSGDSNENN